MKTCRRGIHTFDGDLTRCPECRRIAKAKYRKTHAESIKKALREWYLANKVYVSQTSRQYYIKNRSKINAYNNNWQKKLKQSNALYKFKRNLRNLVYMSISAKGYDKATKTQAILGADFNTVHTHLILSALRNYGVWIEEYKYHIDHIIPIAPAKTEEEVIVLNHYTNLQYLYPHHNIAKSDSLTWHLPSI